MTKPTTPLPNVVLAALEVLSDHIQAQAKALTRIRNIVDAQDSTEDTPTLVEREIEALGKELAAKDRDIQNLETDATIICSDYKELLIDKKIAEARNARFVEWMRGKCECCGTPEKILACNACLNGPHRAGTDNWTLPAGL